MSRPSAIPDELLDEVHDLTLACLSGEAAPEAVARLDQLVCTDDRARRIYVQTMLDGFSLRRWAAMFRPSDASSDVNDAEMPVDGWPDGESVFERWIDGAKQGSMPHPSAPNLAPLPGPSPSAQYPLSNYFSSGWPVAYLVATAIFGIALVIGSLMHVSQPVSPTERIPSVAAGPRTNEKKSPLVGQITQMIDCVWSDPRTEAIPGAYVPLGRKYALASGLMEIAYDSGAKVVLQGPVTYEVESAAGGYLSVGKLTAELEKRSEVRGQRSEAANQKSEIRNQKSFAIRTPTATVTDLGTEFGVEVDRSGSTSTYVFRGLVEVQTQSGNGNQRGKAIRLGKNESAQVKAEEGNTPATIVHGKVNAQGFVRAEQLPRLAQEQRLKPLRRWQAYSQQLRDDPALVAYYTFEPIQGKPSVLTNLSAAGHALNGRIEGAEWVLGRLPGKSALFFHGPKSGDRVALPDPDRFNFPGAFSIAVWFRVMQFTGSHEGLVTKGNQSWRFQQSSERNELKFDTNYGPKLEHGLAGKVEVADRRWHLGVVVYEPIGQTARKQLFVDGRLDAENKSPLSLNRTEHPVWIGANSGYPGLEFQGWIDEVAIFGRALSAAEVQQMFEAGDPRETDRGGSLRRK